MEKADIVLSALSVAAPLYLFVLIILSFWRLFTMAGYAGWSVLVPFYNAFLVTRLAERSPGWAWMMLCAPFTIIALPVVMLGLGKAYGRSAWSGLVPPVLADSGASYVGGYPGPRTMNGTPQRGAFLTSVLLYLTVLPGVLAAVAIVDRDPVAFACCGLIVGLTTAAWFWKRWAIAALPAAVTGLLFIPGLERELPMAIGVLIPVALLNFAYPVGRRLAAAAQNESARQQASPDGDRSLVAAPRWLS